MGENATPEQAAEKLHVLVTGFGPWAANTVNPSFLIARAIHERLDLPGGPEIHVHTLSEPVKVVYSSVREQIPPLLFPPVTHNPPPTFDVVLFIGMAGGTNHYKLETQAFRDDYFSPDDTGKIPEGADRDLWRQLYNAPQVLKPGFDADDVWRRWKYRATDFDLRPSTDAGRFLCEFIFYSGLVEYWRRGRTDNIPVAFMHVPGDHDAEALEKGVKIGEALIQALVESMHKQGKLQPGRK